MKFLISTFLFLLVMNLQGQKAIYYDSLYSFDSSNNLINKPFVLDFNDSLNWDYIFIDTNQASNSWEFAKVNKPGFLVSDSVFLTTGSQGFYDNSQFSSFIIKLMINPNSSLKWFSSFGLGFIHSYQTDSAFDGLTIETSLDGGANWDEDFYSLSNYWLLIRHDSLINWDMFTFIPNTSKVINSGSSNGIEYSRIPWGMLGVKSIYDSLLIRISFNSDSIQTNKAGWAIQKLIVEGNFFEIGSINQNDIDDYFNIFSNGKKVYINSLSSEIQDFQISVYNLMGQRVYDSSSLHHSKIDLDLSHLRQGVYLVHIISKNRRWSKKMMLK